MPFIDWLILTDSHKNDIKLVINTFDKVIAVCYLFVIDTCNQIVFYIVK